LPGRVTITEITGSESFVHLFFQEESWVSLVHGICHFEPDEQIDVYIDPARLMAFDGHGRAALPPPALAA